MVAPSSTSWFVNRFAFVCCWLLLGAAPAAANSVLVGAVTDVITHQPVGGAEVQIEYSGQVVGSGTSDIDGDFKVPFNIPPSAPPLVMMKVSAGSKNHEKTSKAFQVSDGAPFLDRHDISLYPLGVMDCLSQTKHSVIVGHFLSPIGRDFSDLPTRVARSLDYALNTRLQAVRLSPQLQPSFEPCDAAKPRTRRFGANFAKALRADAFVGGEISNEPPRFTVSTYISDAYELFGTPTSATNRDVDLSNPRGAAISAETYVPVLAAIAAGLARKDNCLTALTVLSVAEQMVEQVPDYITLLRKDCEERIPNVGLTMASP